MALNNGKVSIVFTNKPHYPTINPFHPPESYPELKSASTDDSNHVYACVREAFRCLGLDRDNFGTAKWNPLKEIIEPGMTVFLKPNTVAHVHEDKKDVFSVIVHASVLRPILDYVCKALNDEGHIIVGDSQLYASHFDKAMAVSQIQELLDWYRNQTPVPIECFDLRTNRAVRTYLYGRWGRIPVGQDPRGYRFVDLGDLSCFKGIDPKRLRIAIASHKNMYKHHSGGKHEYVFPQSFLDSNAVISIPKLKTHRRTAVTLALKNFMGIPSWKDTLPHFMTGSVSEGGDQYINPSWRKRVVTRLHDVKESNPYIPVKFVCAVAKKILWESHKIFPFKDDVYEAMWYGNDTLWRTLMDLNRIVLYADKQGKIQETQQRKFFSLIDGVVGGEGDGPLSPDPVDSRVFLAGFNPVTVDAVGATLMGHDIAKIPLIQKGFEKDNGRCRVFCGSPGDIQVLNGDMAYTLKELPKHHNLKFEPHPGWKGHVELDG